MTEFMRAILPPSVTQCLPPSVTPPRYRRRMESNSKKTVRENVIALLSRRQPLRTHESGVTRLKSLGVAHGNAQRTVDEESDMRLATLDQVAAALKVAPWQLLVDGLDPGALPQLVPAAQRFSDAALRVAAIYDRVSPSDRRHIDAIADAATSVPVPTPAAADDAPRRPEPNRAQGQQH